jgi:para-aminobenzoate synthetase component 1
MRRALIHRLPGAPPPESLFARVQALPYSLWLDSGLRGAEVGRYSFMALDPFRVLRGRDGRAQWIGPDGAVSASLDPLSELQAALQRYRLEQAPGGLPFCGGAGGYLGYELGRDLERLPSPRARDMTVPDLELGFYDIVIGWDHRRRESWIASTGLPESGGARRERAESRLARILEWLAGGAAPEPTVPGSADAASDGSGPEVYRVPANPRLYSTFTPDGYAEAVGRAIELIRGGDIFQVNLSQRFEGRSPEDPFALYVRLREVNPVPFGAFFRGGSCVILSASPERFLRIDGSGVVQSRPIKGTRPRGATEAEDEELARELEASGKDRAENLMIVDLLRNDLSRVCRPGSVTATSLFRLESFATVHHLVSTVEGRLREGRASTDMLRAAFPCGSVTGAPKIRAMEIITELEPVARGPYCGAIGYLGFAGDIDMSVAIRIVVADRKRAVFHAGGAVVVDSDPVAEYDETLAKVRPLIEAHAAVT